MDAACFSSPVTNSKLVFPMDLSLFLNRLLFFAIAQPGISQVLMKIIDLEGTAIRCRGATEMIGPDGKVGSMIGKTFKDILLNTRLEGTIIIGVNSGDRTPGNHEIGGIAPRPDYVVGEKVSVSALLPGVIPCLILPLYTTSTLHTTLSGLDHLPIVLEPPETQHKSRRPRSARRPSAEPSSHSFSLSFFKANQPWQRLRQNRIIGLRRATTYCARAPTSSFVWLARGLDVGPH